MRAQTIILSFVVPFMGPVLPATAVAGFNAADDEIAALLKETDVAEDLRQFVQGQKRWAMADLLREGFAFTPSPEARVVQVAEKSHRREARLLDAMRHPDWLEAMERRAALARLAGPIRLPAHNVETAAFDIPLADHPLVDSYIEYFTGRGRWFFTRWLERAERYAPIMQPILAEAGLPQDLIYLAMIESGFVSHATSTAQAAGFWQFIKVTGKRFNLEQSFWIDERRDFVKATHSAAAYLTKLYEEFGDWHLAWASYNAGEGRVRRALQKYGVQDFWSLIAHKNSLAKETQHYVPKIIAAAIVAKNRESYGFVDLTPEAPLLFDTVTVKDSVDLRTLAQQFHYEYDQLKSLNPELLQGITPPKRAYTLRVPQGEQEAMAAWIASQPPAERVQHARHRVRKGDTLYALAKRYNTTSTAIAEFNNIGNARALRLGQDLVIPTHASKPKQASARSQAQKPAVQHHKVSKGETLWSISQKYNVSVAAIKRWNRRHGNAIRAGEVLSIFAGES